MRGAEEGEEVFFARPVTAQKTCAVYELEDGGLVLELDEMRFDFGTCYELRGDDRANTGAAEIFAGHRATGRALPPGPRRQRRG